MHVPIGRFFSRENTVTQVSNKKTHTVAERVYQFAARAMQIVWVSLGMSAAACAPLSDMTRMVWEISEQDDTTLRLPLPAQNAAPLPSIELSSPESKPQESKTWDYEPRPVLKPTTVSEFMRENFNATNADVIDWYGRLVNADTGEILTDETRLRKWSYYIFAKDEADAQDISKAIGWVDQPEKKKPKEQSEKNPTPKPLDPRWILIDQISTVKFSPDTEKYIERMVANTSYSEVRAHDIMVMVTDTETGSGVPFKNAIEQARRLAGVERIKAVEYAITFILGTSNDGGHAQIIPEFADAEGIKGPMIRDREELRDKMVQIILHAIEKGYSYEAIIQAFEKIDVRFRITQVTPKVIDFHVRVHQLLEKFNLSPQVHVDLTNIAFNIGQKGATDIAAYMQRTGYSLETSLLLNGYSLRDLTKRRNNLLALHQKKQALSSVGVSSNSDLMFADGGMADASSLQIREREITALLNKLQLIPREKTKRRKEIQDYIQALKEYIQRSKKIADEAKKSEQSATIVPFPVRNSPLSHMEHQDQKEAGAVRLNVPNKINAIIGDADVKKAIKASTDEIGALLRSRDKREAIARIDRELQYIKDRIVVLDDRKIQRGYVLMTEFKEAEKLWTRRWELLKQRGAIQQEVTMKMAA